MITAIQERDDEYGMTFAHVICGEPMQRVAGKLGIISLFAPEQLVAYVTQTRDRVRLYVFRTLARPDFHRTRIPGVRPHVRLLVVAHTSRRMARAVQVLRAVQKAGFDPSALGDEFFLRVATTLAARVAIEDVVASLLAPCSSRTPAAHEA